MLILVEQYMEAFGD